MKKLRICSLQFQLTIQMLVLVALVGVLIDSARIDTLRMCAGMCGVAIGAAYGPLLLIHSVMCSVTGAWVQADVFGLRPRLVFGGGTLHIMDAGC